MRAVSAARHAVRAVVQGRVDVSEEAVCEGARIEFRGPASVQVRLDRSQLEGGMTRRSLLAGAPAVFAACGKGDGEYFGRIELPGSQRLIFHIEAEPETLDPAKSEGGSEEFILPSLFEGLLTLHPHTNELLPGIATHYECD